MEKIAKSAAKFFNEKGYLETSMDDISAAAKLSKGGIYHYFSRKNEIFYFISANYMNIFLKDLEQKLKRINDLFLKIRYMMVFVKSLKSPLSVIPAQAGTQYFKTVRILWIPIPRLIPSRTSFTGMTTFYDFIMFDLNQS